MTKFTLFLLSLLALSTIQAEVKTDVINYKDGKTKLQGYMAYDNSQKGPRPGILVIHAWKGHDEYVQMRARQLAEMGYIAFALDMYGKGKVAKDHKEAAEFSGVFQKNKKLMLSRAQAGLKVLKKHKLSDNSKLAAIGYCFGGTTVITMARAGLDIDAVASFHPVINDFPKITKPIKSKILILYGADDTYSTDTDIKKLKEELGAANADWQMNYYSGSGHSFTVNKEGNAAYNADAERRSWKAMTDLFKESF